MFDLKSVVATASACLWLGASAVQAQEITLRSVDESLSMTGTLTAFDGETYELLTAIGTLKIGVNTVLCEGEDCPDLIKDIKEFTIAGSRSIGLQMMPALIESYAYNLGAVLQTEILSETQVKYTITEPSGEMYSTITLNLGTSNDAFTALESGEAFVGLSARRVNEGERDLFIGLGKGDLTSAAQERILGLDGLTISVNPSNPVRALSLDQVSDIFAGNIRNWREVGGLDLPISLYRQDNEVGSTQVFDSLVMTPTLRTMTNIASILDDNAAVADAIESDRNAIGLVSVSGEPNTNALALRSVCGQISTPSDFLIKTEEYPMSHRLFAYVNGGELPERVVELLTYITSDAAQGAVFRTGFFNQEVSSASLNDQGRRIAHALMAERDPASLDLLQEMMAGLQDAERISLTFRFKDGSVEPDNRAEADIARLASMIQRGDFEGKRLMIIGFAYGSGAITENQRLSQARADSVRDAIVGIVGQENLGSVELTTVGYGELSPIGCDETEDGQDTNRRVEIWVR